MQLANAFFGQQFQNAGVILNGGVGHGEGTGAGGGNAAQLNGFLQHGEEGAADGVEIHQTVNLLLTQGDAFQIVFAEGAHPRGGDLRLLRAAMQPLPPDITLRAKLSSKPE